MYAPLLTNRYLTSRVIPLIAVAAVALCVGLVIVVVSIMSGFLDMLLKSGRSLMGDVIISYPVNGIPYYEKLIDRINKLPETEAATPLISTVGLIRMPYPEGKRKEMVTSQVWCIEPESFGKVVDYGSSMYWGQHSRELIDAHKVPFQSQRSFDDLIKGGMTLRDPATGQPGMVMGMHVSAVSERTDEGKYRPREGAFFMPNQTVTLTLVPISSEGGLGQPEEVRFPVLNEMYTGVFQVDKQRVMIPLDEGQRMLKLNAANRTSPNILDEEGLPKVLGEDPARVTMVLVRAKPNVTPERLSELIMVEYAAFFQQVYDDSSLPVLPPSPLSISIRTWEEQLADLIGPVRKERELMRTLFSIVNVVCAALVLSIFWAIVYEKTRDIGILRSVGASRMGVVWIFLRYGLAVGVTGSILGFGLGWTIVRNINVIQLALAKPPIALVVVLLGAAIAAVVTTIVHSLRGRFLPVVVGTLASLVLLFIGGGALWFRIYGGFTMWDKKVYYFDHIPNAVDYTSALLAMAGAVIFSLIGAAVPAAKAADTDPVQALRYE
jgi:lipoprotein-releasing system permease protein